MTKKKERVTDTYPIYQKLNSNCPDAEKNGSGPGSCSGGAANKGVDITTKGQKRVYEKGDKQAILRQNPVNGLQDVTTPHNGITKAFVSPDAAHKYAIDAVSDVKEVPDIVKIVGNPFEKAKPEEPGEMWYKGTTKLPSGVSVKDYGSGKSEFRMGKNSAVVEPNGNKSLPYGVYGMSEKHPDGETKSFTTKQEAHRAAEGYAKRGEFGQGGSAKQLGLRRGNAYTAPAGSKESHGEHETPTRLVPLRYRK